MTITDHPKSLSCYEEAR